MRPFLISETVTIYLAFLTIDEQFCNLARKFNYGCGTTCLLGIVMNGKLTLANLGDSVATLVRKDSSWTKLNEEHAPNRPDEQMRIQNNNGIIFNNRVEGQLSVSRAFGNVKLKDFVIAEPEG